MAAYTLQHVVLLVITGVRNLGAYFDKYMSMEQHFKSECQAAYAVSVADRFAKLPRKEITDGAKHWPECCVELINMTT